MDQEHDQPPIDPKQLAAFRSGMASEANKVIIAGYKDVTARFSAALKAALENHDAKRLRELAVLASLHQVTLGSWIDATLEYAADSNLLILRDYWQETADDIIAALKRGLDDDPSEAWKQG